MSLDVKVFGSLENLRDIGREFQNFGLTKENTSMPISVLVLDEFRDEASS